jgi:hypothetical protein
MNVFDIRNSIVKPFDRIQAGDIPRVYPQGYMVEDYVSRNLACGGPELNNLKMLINSSNNQINGALRDVGSAIKVLDGCVNAGFNAAIAAAGVLDTISALTDKLTSLGLNSVEKLKNLDFRMPDLNLKISLPDATDIKNMFNKISTGLSNMIDSALTALSNFSPENLMDKLTDFDFDIPLPDDPISSLAKMLECQSDDALALLETGLTNMLGGSFEGLDNVNPLSGTMAVVNAVQGGVGGALNAINAVQGGINGLASQAGGFVNGLTGQANAMLSGLNPKLGGFLQQLGVPSLVNTALSDSMRNAFSSSKSYTACSTAQSLNKFGNYDPFISSVFGVKGLNTANATMYGGYNPNASDNSCKCCAKKKEKYLADERYALMNRNTYDLTKSYRGSLNGDMNSPIYVKTGNIPADEHSRTLATYGFRDDNMLTSSIGTNLETYRLARKLQGNMSELSVDFSKYGEFESEATADLKYVHDLNEDLVTNNLANIEDLSETAYSLMA